MSLPVWGLAPLLGDCARCSGAVVQLQPWVWRAVVAVAVGLATAAGLITLGVWAGSGSHGDDLWFELAKGGISLGVVAVIGGIIASLLRSVDSAREQSRRDGDYRLNSYRNILAAYNDLKAVRRGLRASGVRDRPRGPLPAEQVSEIRAALLALDRVQLTFESSALEVKNQPDRHPKSEAMHQALERLEQYSAELIGEWESWGGTLWPGVDGAALAPFEHLQSFLGESSEGFETEAGAQMRIVTEALFPPPRPRARRTETARSQSPSRHR